MKRRDDWTYEEYSRLARQRDNDTCQDCGAQPPKPLRGVRIDEFKPDSLKNLVTLCYQCERRRADD